jgi:copper oxidase (laccase) domain-containing protein
MKNAAGATVRAMVGQLGCQPEDIIAVIGPAIGPCCYEVGPEVMTEAAETFQESDTLFTRRNGHANRAYFDMWEANRRQLAAAGVEQIIQSGLCTACRTDLFFSHRAEKGRTGRFGVIIGLRGESA